MGNLLISALVLLATGLVPQLSQLHIVTYSYLIGFIIIASLFLFSFYKQDLIVTSKIQQKTDTFKESYSSILITLAILSISTIALYILNNGLTLTQSINIDTYHHLTAIKEIYFNNNLGLLLTNINDTFTLATYLPFFHYIFGVPLSTGELIDLVLLYRVLEVIFTLTLSLITYKGINILTKSKPLSIFAVILHIFAFESFGAYTSHFMLPQTFTGIMAFVLIIYVLKTDKINSFYLLSALILLGLNHFFVGVFAVIIILFIALIRKFNKAVVSIVSFSIFVALLLFIGADVLSLSVLDGVGQVFSDFSERESELINLGSIDLLNVLFRSFGTFSLILILQIVSSPLAKDWRYKTMGFVLTLTLLIISIKFPYSNKFLIYIHYFSVIFVTLGLSNIKVFSKWISLILIIPLGITLALGLQINTQRFKNIFTGDDNQIRLMEYEYDISKELEAFELSAHNTLIISDPLTMHMIEPITDTTTTGGLFTKAETRKVIWETLKDDINLYQDEIDTSSHSIYITKATISQGFDKFSFSNDYDQVIIIITPRTLLWLSENEKFIEGYGNQIWKVD